MSEKNVDKAELLVEQIWNEKHKPGQAYPRKHQWKKAIKEALDTQAREYEAEIAELKKPTLYDGLCKAIIGRILEADANCEPPHDILLRLETIIRNKEYLQTKIKDHEALIGVLVGAINEAEAWSPGYCFCLSEEEANKAGGKTCPPCVLREALSNPLVQEYLKKEKI